MIQLRGLHAELRPYAEHAVRWANHYGINPTITSVYRTWEEQQRLRMAYLAGRSRFPANRPGDSAHNFGLAWDSWVPEGQRPSWRWIREQIGWRVPPNDWIHSELPNWRDVVHG